MDIVTFCASHISTESRIVLLNNVIESIIRQTHKSYMFVSISCESDELLAQLQQKIIHHDDYVKLYFHEHKKLSQFEHYSFLLDQIDPVFYNRTWVMFTDDDDYSTTLRTKWYHIYIITKDTKCKSICNPYMLLFKNSNNHIPTYAECFTSLETGRSNVTSTREYVTYCVRLNVLKTFICVMNKHKLLHTPLCDVVFSSVLYNVSGEYDWTSGATWAYAYNLHSGVDRMTKKYHLDYYKKTYKKSLFKDLAAKFNISKWKVEPGYTPIWTKPKNNRIIEKIIAFGTMAIGQWWLSRRK